MVVGIVNVLVVAFCIAVMEGGREIPQMMIFIFMFGCIPGTACGGVLGHVAEKSTNVPRWILLGTMILFSCVTVACLGAFFDVKNLILVSCIPTVAACSVLERWTRPAPPPIPVARAS